MRHSFYYRFVKSISERSNQITTVRFHYSFWLVRVRTTVPAVGDVELTVRGDELASSETVLVSRRCEAILTLL